MSLRCSSANELLIPPATVITFAAFGASCSAFMNAAFCPSVRSVAIGASTLLITAREMTGFVGTSLASPAKYNLIVFMCKPMTGNDRVKTPESGAALPLSNERGPLVGML